MIHVLYVDGRSDLPDGGKEILEQTGALSVDTAASADRATEMQKHHPFDVVVADFPVPGMDSLSFLNSIRAVSGDIPVIFISTLPIDSSIARALNSTTVLFLQKSTDKKSQYDNLRGTILKITMKHPSPRNQPSVVRTLTNNRGHSLGDRTSLAENRKIMRFTLTVWHDIANRLTVLRGRLRVIRKQYDDPVLLKQLEMIDNAGKDIYGLLESSRMYQELGMSTPRWQNVEEMIMRVQDPREISSFHISLRVSDLEICTDPQCDRVFANLLENTVRHGIHATEIRVSFHKSEEGGTIVWEDNGVGIPVDLKERVFEQGYGTNTGLGLFLCREILSETGITIQETGIPGNGARFEIAIPGHGWRVSGNPLGVLGDPQTEKSKTPSEGTE